MSTVKTPPVEGWRETSPSEVENVERSSWAYFVCFSEEWVMVNMVGRDWRTDVGCAEEPFALGAVFDCYSW